MKQEFTLYFSLLFFGFLLAPADCSAQATAYRQTNLASNVASTANHLNMGLINPWGIAFQPGQPFFVADNRAGRITQHDALGFGSPAFIVPNPSNTGPDSPTGIVADVNSAFGNPTVVSPYIIVAEEGTVFLWGPDAHGNLLQEAVLVVNNSSKGAVYKGVAILNSSMTTPAVAVTDFQGGFVQAFLPGFNPVALPGSFTDPNLPAGYAPFGIQLVANQVFVTYAVQDAAKHDPVTGAGNGIVNIFSMDGIFVRRFATGGPLNAPWGVTQASANFGVFSNDILIGNAGDGTIDAFDSNGNFLGQIKDGDGNVIVNSGLHALTFRSDGAGDPNALYFTAGINNGQGGLFGAITAGMVSTTRVSVPLTPTNTSARFTATVAAGPGNAGVPTGTVAFADGGISRGAAPIVNGVATLDSTLAGMGIHIVGVQYSGDAKFLPSSSQTQAQVTGPATMVTLTAPANAAPGSPVNLVATITSPGGIPTGQIVFQDGNSALGSAPLNATGVATLSVSTLAAGNHTLTASFAGGAAFSGSISTAVTLTVANPDFTLAANPSSVTVMAGHSTQIMLSVTPSGGFANQVNFSCSVVAGITCAFNPPTVTPANAAASTMLTVTTSGTVSRYGFLPLRLIGPGSLLIALASFSLFIWWVEKLQSTCAPVWIAAAGLALIALSVTLGGCGGYVSGTTQPNRGTASIMVTAQSGSISHTAMVNVTVQ